MSESKQEMRKLDHIELALKAQTMRADVDQRFYYEPFLSSHPTNETDLSLVFLGKKMAAPFWISSMTGGVGAARHLNQNLARVCKEFGLGMGLGSCRILLDGNSYSNTFFDDFNLRPIIGPDLPFYANLGIAQIEELIASNSLYKISDMVKKLEADGLIVHVNFLQEWFQPEGDRLKSSALLNLKRLCEQVNIPIIVKEVGQGIGPKSLQALLELPIVAIELAAFGGTNFSKLEQLRSKNSSETGMAFYNVGHTASEMVSFLNDIALKNNKYNKCEIIISGGIQNALDGFYLQEKLSMPSVVGLAKNFLNHAENYDDLRSYTSDLVSGFKLAKSCLVLKEKGHL